MKNRPLCKGEKIVGWLGVELISVSVFLCGAIFCIQISICLYQVFAYDELCIV